MDMRTAYSGGIVVVVDMMAERNVAAVADMEVCFAGSAVCRSWG